MSLRACKSMGGLGLPPLAPPPRRTTSALPSIEGAGGGGGGASAPAPPHRGGNRRPGGDGRMPPTARRNRDRRREYELLHSQTLLLAATASASFVLFLLFTLPLPALIGLTVMVTSLGACLLVAYAAAKTRYRLEMEHPLGLVRHLPRTVRDHLMEKSLHDCLSPSGSSGSLVSLAASNSRDSLSTMSQGCAPSMASPSSSARPQLLDRSGRQRHRHAARSR